MVGTVYLIRLSEKLANHAQYYIGFTTQHPIDRLQDHRNGKGSRMLAAAVNQGIEINIVRIWENQPKSFERDLKNRKNAKQLCPIINKKHKVHKYKYHKR